MNASDSSVTRRSGMVTGGRWALGYAAVILAAPVPARAGKVDKRDFHYQEQPKAGKRCATCRQYTAVDDEKGRCAVVEGEIAADGWCIAYTAK